MNDQRPTAASFRGSLVLPFFLAVSAPLAVFFGIKVLRSVWWTFAMYQGAICLLAPAIESRLEGRGWREHAVMLGLLQAPENRVPVRRWLLPSVILGSMTALVTAGFLILTRDRYLDPDHLNATLAGWGVSPERVPAMLAFMAMLDAAAEELFWRGYFPGRVALTRPDRNRSIVLTVFLPSVLYASYHAVTIAGLVGATGGVVILTGGVLAAGLLWGWLRWRTGSVWPSLLSHGGAVLAYLGVHLWLTSGRH